MTDNNDALTADEKGVSDAYDKFAELPDAPPRSSLKLSWVGKLAVAVIAFWLILAAFGTWIAPYHEADIIAEDGYLASYVTYLQCDGKEPSGFFCGDYEPEHFEEIGSDEYAVQWMGSDYLGRDILSRIVWGARTTIGIALAATVLAYLIGITAGMAAAVKGGWIDMGLSRVNDAILSLPTIMLGLIVIAALGSSIPILVGTAGAIYASSVFRIARALGQDIMVQDFVEAARARGEGVWWIIRREVLPNAAMPLATDFGLRLVFVVLFISSLSYLGLGVQPPTADWGSMVRQNLQGLGYGSYAAIWPALAIASFTISVNLIVDDLSAAAGGSLAKKMV
ncbi:MAG: ABC transporter permease [Chromatiales bacterium]|jgi:peptide/nickel transport system permease protein|nr:ABC transporter permease [Chromatiales bacterium]